MKALLYCTLWIMFALTAKSQQTVKLDSLLNQLKEIDSTKNQLYNQIFEEIKLNGYHMSYSPYSKSSAMLFSENKRWEVAANIEAGSDVIVYGKYALDYLVKYKEIRGYVSIPKNSFDPLIFEVLDKFKSIDYPDKTVSKGNTETSGFKSSSTKSTSSSNISSGSSSRSSSSGCASTQCSGKTQKGARCRNRTTNCSGRCHHH